MRIVATSRASGMADIMNQDARLYELASQAFDKATGLALLDTVADSACVGLLILDDKENIHWANHTFEMSTGFSPDLSMGRPSSAFVAEKDQSAFALCLKTARQTRRSPACVITFRAADESEKPFRIEASVVTDQVGRLFYVVAIISRSDKQAGASLSDSAFVHDVVAHLSDGLMVINNAGEIAFCNEPAAALFGRDEPSMIGTAFGFPFSVEGEWTSLETSVNGCPVHVDMRATSITWNGQDATLATLRDVTDRHEVEAVVAMQMSAMEAAANGIFITDIKGHFKWANGSLGRMSGYNIEELIGQPASILNSGEQDAEFFKKMWETVLSGETWRGEVVNRHKDGHLYTVEQSVTPIRDGLGRLTQFVAIQDDITDRLKAQAEIVHLAEFDTLTDLPNRELFMDRLATALDRAARSDRRAAVMVMDLDDFKDVNSTLGHDVGDQLIITVTERVQSLMRTTDTIARLGGDEFGLLLEDLEDMNAADRLVRRILDIFNHTIEVAGRPLKISASIGIAAYPEDDVNPLNLLRHAELAMYRAKSESRHSFQYFDQAMDDEIRQRVSLEHDLRSALANKELWLAYQPQIDLQTGEVIGAEALLRWNHPKLGFVSPGEFIPVAEACGLILPIGDWIIEEICRQLEAWREAGLPLVQVGINVSGHQFKQRELGTQVLDQLSRSGLQIDAVDLEITETVAMERTDQVTRNVEQLVEAGISISMDDFGTGYSSLSNLQAFPVRRLKVDGSFVSGIGKDHDDEKIVEAVVGLGHSLGLSVIAEGVETEEQLAFLKDRQCDEIQGYLISRPLSVSDFETFLRAQPPTTLH